MSKSPTSFFHLTFVSLISVSITFSVTSVSTTSSVLLSVSGVSQKFSGPFLSQQQPGVDMVLRQALYNGAIYIYIYTYIYIKCGVHLCQ